MSLIIEIDPRSGFCFGVVKAIEAAEAELDQGSIVYSLGELVHNGVEMERLGEKGLEAVNHDRFKQLSGGKILFRAHGEPPSSYDLAKRNQLEIVDATCPVVLKLQLRIKKAHEALAESGGQIVIYGKNGHPEVTGLLGQIGGEAIVVENIEDIDKIDFNRPVELFSQTTKSISGFNALVEAIGSRMKEGVSFSHHDTVCRQVANRIPWLTEFSKSHDAIVFVGGVHSSNAKVLFQVCKNANANSFFVSEIKSIDPQWFNFKEGVVGICGATSTPRWQLEQVAQAIQQIIGPE